MDAQDWQVGENQLQSSCGSASWEGRSRLARVGEARIETLVSGGESETMLVASPAWARRGLKQLAVLEKQRLPMSPRPRGRGAD